VPDDEKQVCGVLDGKDAGIEIHINSQNEGAKKGLLKALRPTSSIHDVAVI